MSIHLEFVHAQKDEETALFLYSQKKSIRWTTIICFYSALHYVRGKMFPLTESTEGASTTYNNYDSYYSAVCKNLGISMHDGLVKLTWKNLLEIGPKYQWLFDTSYTARYRNYQEDERDAAKAVKYLVEIKKVCNKK